MARNGHSEVLDTRDGSSPPDPLHALSPCSWTSARDRGRPYWLVQLEILGRCGLALNPTLGIRRAPLAPPLNVILPLPLVVAGNRDSIYSFFRGVAVGDEPLVGEVAAGVRQPQGRVGDTKERRGRGECGATGGWSFYPRQTECGHHEKQIAKISLVF